MADTPTRNVVFVLNHDGGPSFAVLRQVAVGEEPADVWVARYSDVSDATAEYIVEENYLPDWALEELEERPHVKVHVSAVVHRSD